MSRSADSSFLTLLCTDCLLALGDAAAAAARQPGECLKALGDVLVLGDGLPRDSVEENFTTFGKFANTLL